MPCSAMFRPRLAIRLSRSGMISPSSTGGFGSAGSLVSAATAGATAAGPTSQSSAATGRLERRTQRLWREEVAVAGAVSPRNRKVRIAARPDDGLGQCPAAAGRKHAVRLCSERRDVGDVRQDRLSPDDVEAPVCERERVAERIDDLDRALQADGGVDFGGKAPKTRGRLDRRHVNAEARREDAGGPPMPAPDRAPARPPAVRRASRARRFPPARARGTDPPRRGRRRAGARDPSRRGGARHGRGR